MKSCVMTWLFPDDNFKNYLISLLNIKKKDSSEVYGGQLLDLYGKFNSQILSNLLMRSMELKFAIKEQWSKSTWHEQINHLKALP